MFNSWKTSFVIRCAFGVVSNFPSSVKTLPDSQILSLTVLLAIIYSVFWHLIVSPFFKFSFITLFMSSYSFISVSSINTVSSKYLMLLRACSPIINPGRTSISHRITSLYRLNKSTEKRHFGFFFGTCSFHFLYVVMRALSSKYSRLV